VKGQNAKSITSYLVLFFSLIFLAYFQHFLNARTQKPKIVISKQDEALNLNENFLRLLSFGQERLLSSLIWVHTLLESDIEHYKEDDLNSWMYLRFKTISVLDPYFYENYHYGGKYLSIIKDDLLGARDIYERGFKYFPDDFWLRFNNGFNYYFEMGEPVKGLYNFSIIENSPMVPKLIPYLPTMIAKMRAEKGQTQLAFDMLLKIYQNNTEKSLFKERQAVKLFELKAEIDLACLNERRGNCDRIDFKGRPYILKDGEYKAQSINTN
jgi:hypothetical protein